MSLSTLWAIIVQFVCYMMTVLVLWKVFAVLGCVGWLAMLVAVVAATLLWCALWSLGESGDLDR